MKRWFRLPSPALIISMVALALVLGGTAVAAVATDPDKAADTLLIKHLAPTLSVKNAKTVGGKQVKQFFASLPANTAAQALISIDGVVLKGACDVDENPGLTIENDSGYAGSLAGYAKSVGEFHLDAFSATPYDLSTGLNGGGFATAMLSTGKVVSVQWIEEGNLGGAGTSCTYGGSVVAS